jgi:hypothetical protein
MSFSGSFCDVSAGIVMPAHVGLLIQVNGRAS